VNLRNPLFICLHSARLYLFQEMTMDYPFTALIDPSFIFTWARVVLTKVGNEKSWEKGNRIRRFLGEAGC